MMDEWTKTKGFPILTVELQSQDDSSQIWKVEQRSCHWDNEEQLWKIPLTTVSTSGEKHEFMIKEQCHTIVVPITKPSNHNDSKTSSDSEKETLIKFNSDSTSFCLIKYNETYLKTLWRKGESFSFYNRMWIVNEIQLDKSLEPSEKVRYMMDILFHLRKMLVKENTEQKTSSWFRYDFFTYNFGSNQGNQTTF